MPPPPPPQHQQWPQQQHYTNFESPGYYARGHHQQQHQQPPASGFRPPARVDPHAYPQYHDQYGNQQMPNGMSFTASTPGFNNYYAEPAQPSQNEVMMASQSDQSFEQEPNDGAKNKSKVSVDVNQPFKDRFYHHDNERHFQQTVNNDDIFLCYDFYDEMSKGGGQRSLVSNESVVPKRGPPHRKISKQGFAPGFEPKGPGNRSFANPGTSGVLSNRSGISEKFLKDPPQFQKVKPGFLDNIGAANPPHRNQLHSPTSFVMDDNLPASPRVTHDPVALRPAGPRFKGARQSQKMSQR